MKFMILLVWCFCFPFVEGLIGYDCAGFNMNISTFSLIEVGECKIPHYKPMNQTVNLMLLQSTELTPVEVIQCKIEINREITHCGMHSHASRVLYGSVEYLYDVDLNQCKEMIQTKSTKLYQKVNLYDLRVNSTSRRQAVLAGQVQIDGTCQGETYSDHIATWSNVLVTAQIKVSIFTYTALANVKDDTIKLINGARCLVDDLHCVDNDGGHAFWTRISQSSCNFDTYSVLYAGTGTKIIGDQDHPDVYTVETEGTVFALTQKSLVSECNLQIIATRHPKLFVLLAQAGGILPIIKPIVTEEIDIFAYVNSNLLYVERHYGQQMNGLYYNVMLQNCETDRKVIMGALALSNNRPEEFGFHLMKGPGYYTKTAGELVHVIKCMGVKVDLRETTNCYQELPVIYNNQSFFLTPKSRILIKKATAVECDAVFPVGYNIDGQWRHLTPRAMRAPAPLVLQPMEPIKWEYERLEYLATGGIYTQEQQDQWRQRTMHGTEKLAVLEAVIDGVSGRAMPEGMSFKNILDEETISNLAESAMHKFWSGFVQFGSVSAAIMSILFIFQIVKLVLDTVIHGKALHEVYGCGLHLAAALIGSLANYMLHRNHRSNREQHEKKNEENLQEVVITQPESLDPMRDQKNESKLLPEPQETKESTKSIFQRSIYEPNYMSRGRDGYLAPRDVPYATMRRTPAPRQYHLSYAELAKSVNSISEIYDKNYPNKSGNEIYEGGSVKMDPQQGQSHYFTRDSK